MDLINSYKDIVSLNLREYENLEEETKRIIITDEMKEVILTSDNITCNCSIFVNKRSADLTIIINNLGINSKKEIAIDLRGSIEYQYKTYLIFSGKNLIKSEGNIGICVSNNRVVEIIAKENGILDVQSGKGTPAVGNNFYTSGKGEIIFSGEGNINAVAGGGSNSKEIVTWSGENGSYAIGLYNDNLEELSKISILDNVNLRAIGEAGQSIRSISESNKAGDGGSAIYSNGYIDFKKSSNGKLELIGGSGGACEGEYFCGACGNGGNAICINIGIVYINGDSILIGGSGGSVNNKLCISKGGKGGDVISVCKDRSDDEEKKNSIKIYEGVSLISGKGGDSGIGIGNSKILYVKGGNGGNIINANNANIEVYKNIEDNISLGIGGDGLKSTYNEYFDGRGDIGQLYTGSELVVKELDCNNLNIEQKDDNLDISLEEELNFKDENSDFLSLEDNNLNILSINCVDKVVSDIGDTEVLINENTDNNCNEQEILEDFNEITIEIYDNINLIQCKSVDTEIKKYRNYYKEIISKIISFIKRTLFK